MSNIIANAGKKSFSPSGNQSQRSSSTASADIGRIYSARSGTSASSSSSRFHQSGGASQQSGAAATDTANRVGPSTRVSDRNIILMNVDSDDEGYSGTRNGIIRVEMQPKRQIRTREVLSDQVPKETEVLFSKQASDKICDYSEISIAKRTFQSGTTASKALEQTHLFSEGLIWREADSQSEENAGEKPQLLDLDDDQGAEVCKTYLCSVERLICSLALPL